MSAGEYVSINDIKKSIEASSLKSRGILPGDVVLIYTGWSENYQDPDELNYIIQWLGYFLLIS